MKLVKTNPFNRLIIPFALLFATIFVGILGYTMLEEFSVFQAIYMVVITLSTVGFREIRPLSFQGQLLTISIIIMGVTTVAYTAGKFIEIIVEGEIVGYRRRKRMERKTKELRNHFIICGYGRVGHQVGEVFQAHKIPFVVIDSKPETSDELEGTGIPYAVGDASSDDILETVGVRRAKGLVAANDSDVANVFVCLTARVLNPKLYIVARSSHLESEKKLKKAGANRVISPYFISGQRMATMVLRPVTVDFIDTVLRGEKAEQNIEEILVAKKSKIVGKTIGGSEVKAKTGVSILAIKRFGGDLDLHPSAKTKIESGDTLVVLGTTSELHDLESMME